MTEQAIHKAGAIILSSKNKQNIALLYRGKQNDWSFPKGHIEQGENYTQTMIREIREETGLTVSIIQKLPDHFYTNLKEGLISTKMFLVISEDDSKLKPEFEADDIQWIPYVQVVEKLSYDNLKGYFTSIISVIEKIYNTVA